MADELGYVEVEFPDGQIVEVARATRDPEVVALEASLVNWRDWYKLAPRPEPVLVEDKGEPVWVQGLDRYYLNADEAADAVFDEMVDPTKVLAHPCDVRPVSTPDLIEMIEEAWGQDFDEPEAMDIGVPKPLRTIIIGLQPLLAQAAPVAWHPRLRERVQLPQRAMPDPLTVADSLRITHGASPEVYVEGGESGGCA